MKVALIVLAVIVIVVIIRFKQKPPEPSKNAEVLRKMKELGVIEQIPDDPEAYMEKAHTAKRLAEEWAESMQSKQGMIGNDGFPVYETIYPLAIDHYLNASGYSPSSSDKQSVTKAALHFDKYWRTVGDFPQEESGEADWFTIYGQIQDHQRQWINGMIP